MRFVVWFLEKKEISKGQDKDFWEEYKYTHDWGQHVLEQKIAFRQLNFCYLTQVEKSILFSFWVLDLQSNQIIQYEKFL